MDPVWDGFTVHNWQQDYSRYFEIFDEPKPISGGDVKIMRLVHGSPTAHMAKNTTAHEIQMFERRLGFVPVGPVTHKKLSSGKLTKATPTPEDGGLSEWPRSNSLGAAQRVRQH